MRHLRKVYGENRVSNVATFRTEKSKAAVQTAARGLGIDVDKAQYVSGLITTERGAAYTLSQMYYGDEEEGIKPNQTFIEEINKYPGWWETAKNIEGIICGIGIHAGGVVFLDKDFTDSSALMRAPDGTIITQYELHDLEDVSMIKMDLLSIEAADKIHTCLNLLMEHGYVKPEATLRKTYEKVVGVYNIERENKEMWDMVQDHKVISLFQMEQQSGIRGIALTHPRNVDELATLNSVIRLMATEKGAESPLDKYARFRLNPQDWENEMIQCGLMEQERALLHRELDISNGLSITQEQFMQLVQLPECGGWDLQFADKLRKSIAKKKPEEYEALTKKFFERVEEKKLSKRFCNYVWNVEVALSRGYGFNASHTYAYSIIALQEMNLAKYFPVIFWNTANLIVDSGGDQLDLEDDEDENLDDFTLTDIPETKYDMTEVWARRKDVSALELAVNVAEQKTVAERASMLPQLAIVGAYSVTNPNSFNGFKNKFGGMFSVGAMLSIPIWHWGGNYNKYRVAKSETVIRRLELEDVKEKIELQVNQASYKMHEALRIYSATCSNLENAQENLRTAQLGFREGVLTADDVLAAHTAWLKANSEVVDAIIDVRLCNVYLDKVIGRLGIDN